MCDTYLGHETKSLAAKIMTDILQGDPEAPLAESGLTLGWLVETLLKCNPEFTTTLGMGHVLEVSITAFIPRSTSLVGIGTGGIFRPTPKTSFWDPGRGGGGVPKVRQFWSGGPSHRKTAGSSGTKPNRY